MKMTECKKCSYRHSSDQSSKLLSDSFCFSAWCLHIWKVSQLSWIYHQPSLNYAKKKKKCLFLITRQNYFESVGRIKILSYLEILFLYGPLLAKAVFEKVLLTFLMCAMSSTGLYLHKNQGRKWSFSNKTCRFTFLSNIGRFVKEKIM